ncbi:MAG: acyl-CoA/acyl-ACP dehydrogenase [Gammaproteobacteria bacterium]|nr:acyl-CoA/acyl-ACP dehydrogenase [Rhodospirillaceae bacterium]MDE0365345.1 acyl-CoA/acyl-ACP dehydrogenase [Gammaproteobacteria bacterium]
MDFDLTEEHLAMVDAVSKVCSKFDDEYWSEKDRNAEFPHEFHRAMAEGGWLGITMPEEMGGSGLGVTEAALMMNAVGRGGGAAAAMSTLQINLFAPQPIVVLGTPEQKERMLRPLINGSEKTCFGVTEPNAGLNTTAIKTFAERVQGGYRVNGSKIWTSTAQEADNILLLTRTTPLEECAKATGGMTIFFTKLDRDRIEVHRIPKMGRAAVDSNAIFIEDLFVPEEDRVGEEGKGFHYLLHSLNPERIIVAAGAIGIAEDALKRASLYAREREVFGRPIGQNQGIQHPLAENWVQIEAARMMMLKAANLYDTGKPCGAYANAAKLLSGRAAFDTATQAVLTHGGMGYAKEYQVERLMRESILQRLAPVSEQLILSFIAEKELDLPKSY